MPARKRPTRTTPKPKPTIVQDTPLPPDLPAPTTTRNRPPRAQTTLSARITRQSSRRSEGKANSTSCTRSAMQRGDEAPDGAVLEDPQSQTYDLDEDLLAPTEVAQLPGEHSAQDSSPPRLREMNESPPAFAQNDNLGRLDMPPNYQLPHGQWALPQNGWRASIGGGDPLTGDVDQNNASVGPSFSSPTSGPLTPTLSDDDMLGPPEPSLPDESYAEASGLSSSVHAGSSSSLSVHAGPSSSYASNALAAASTTSNRHNHLSTSMSTSGAKRKRSPSDLEPLDDNAEPPRASPERFTRVDKGKGKARAISESVNTEGDAHAILPPQSQEDDERPPPAHTTLDKGKGKARATSTSPISSDHANLDVLEISDSPARPRPPSHSPKPVVEPDSLRPSTGAGTREPLSAYTCPICFGAPTNATLTPCGHICCGACLFAAVKATMARAALSGPVGPGGRPEARCPVCRAVIPNWDGKGRGVIGLQVRTTINV